MKKNLLLGFIAFSFAITSVASYAKGDLSGLLRNGQMSMKKTNPITNLGEIPQIKSLSHAKVPSDPLPPLVSVPGATWVGIKGYYDLQTNRSGLHNIQVDPENPNNIHAAVMSAFDVTVDDTVAQTYSQRRVYYVFSSDGGVSWSAPKSISTLRAGFCDMVLLKRNGKYIPIIAAHHIIAEGSASVVTAIYIEQGDPGTGNFKQVDGTRTTYNNATKDIIWPTLTLSKDGSKVFVSSAVYIGGGGSIDNVQFGTFTLTEGQMNATWSGWKPGPGRGDSRSYTQGGDQLLRTSASGKIGMVWQNYDFGTPDLALYYSESVDDGTTWTDPISVFTPVATQATTSSGDPMILRSQSGFDFFFDGEDPVVVFSGYYDAGVNTSANEYIPASGSLLYWRKGMTTPKLLVSKQNDSDLGDPLYTGDFLSTWTASSTVDPQTANLEQVTIAQTADPKKFTVFFEAWVQDDTADVGPIGDGTRSSYPFHSIYQMTTLDGGTSWQEPIAYKVNDVSAPADKHIDYRYPQVSTFNPAGASSTTHQTMFQADSMAGTFVLGATEGGPSWAEDSWWFQKDEVSRVRGSITNAGSFTLANYPNPVISGNTTTISFSLDNTSNVTLVVTDVLGRTVTQINEGKLSGGAHEISFSTKNLATGVYNYCIRAGAEAAFGAMNVIR